MKVTQKNFQILAFIINASLMLLMLNLILKNTNGIVQVVILIGWAAMAFCIPWITDKVKVPE